MESDYGARYRDLYERHWWWLARKQVILDALRTHEPPSGWRNVLDVGCGDGLFFNDLAKLPGVQLIEGVEPAADLVSPSGPHSKNIHVVPFDASFDRGRRYSLVLMLDVLEHLPDPTGSLRHALSLLEPGGIFLATVPSFMSLWTRHDDLNHHFTRYDKVSFATLAADAGMRIVESRYFFHWLAGAKILTRIKESLIPGEPESPTVPPRWANRALYAIARFEQRVLGSFQIPYGSSLLVVGTAAR
ncbi:MAG: class I SAM-dependent methyltransferase [Gemmatimonadaceae bacterium]